MPNRATLIRSLTALQAERRTGVLTVSISVPEARRLVLCLQDGALIFATETTPGTTFGGRLVRDGKLPAAMHDEIASAMSKTFAFEGPVRFCEAGVQLGIISQAMADKALDEEVQMTVRAAFGAGADREWSFEDTSVDYVKMILELVRRTPIAAEAAFLQASRAFSVAEKEAVVSRYLDAALVLLGDVRDLTQRFQLSKSELELLDAISKGATIRDAMRRANDQSLDVLGLVVALLDTRVLRESVAPPSSRRVPAAGVAPSGPVTATDSSRQPHSLPEPQTSSRERHNPYLTGGSGPSSPNPLEKKTVREAFAPVGPPQPARSERISLLVDESPRPPQASAPAVSSKPTLRSNQDQPPAPSGAAPKPGSPLPSRPTTDPFIPKARQSDIQASMRSSNPSAPPRRTPPPNATEAMLMGDRAFSAALAQVRLGKWSAALPELERASELMPTSEKVALCLRWTKLQLRHEPPSKADRAELARAALAATKNDAEFGFAYYVAGDLALLDDDIITAERLLQKAAKFDPQLADATRLLRVVERRTKEAPSKGGILGKKLF